MKFHLTLITAAALALLGSGALQAADFAFGFAGVPPTISGAPGADVNFIAEATLTTTNAGDAGAQGWSLGVAAENCVITAIVVEGVVVNTLWDADPDPLVPPGAVERTKDLVTSGFKSVKLANTNYVAVPPAPQPPPDIFGAVSAIVLNNEEFEVLLPTGTQVVAKIAVKVTIPTGEDCVTARIYYFNGLKGPGQPVNNAVTYKGETVTPTLDAAVIQLCPRASGGLRIPGDANDDGTLDISDAVAMLGFLYLGNPKHLPCDDGSATDPANVKLIDWQPDGAIDISDAVAMLTFLYLGGDSHVLAPEVGADGCARIVGCLDHCGQ